MPSAPCPDCGFVLIDDDDEPQRDCPGCGRPWQHLALGHALLSSVLGESPTPAVMPAEVVPAAAPTPSRFRRGFISGLVVATIAGVGLTVLGLWPNAATHRDAASAEQNDPADNRLVTVAPELTQAREELQRAHTERDEARSQRSAADKALAALQERHRELERTHAESLEILRAAQAERDEIVAELEQTENDLTAALASGGTSFVRRWQVLGPLKNPDRRVKDDIERDPFRAEYKADGPQGPSRWKLFESSADKVSLDRACDYHEQGECYIVSWLYSPQAQSVRLSIGSDDGCCVWLNRQKVLERRENRAANPGQDRIDAELKRGWNEVLANIDNVGGGEWAFYLETQNRDGQPLPMSQSPLPPRTRAGRDDRS
jgi:hypothetical protein